MTQKELGSILPFVAVFIAVLILGWWIFPHITFSEQEQPLKFNHKLHMELEDQVLRCTDCHHYRKDGSFGGFPDSESCAESQCHDQLQTSSPAEKKLINQYLEKDKPIPWKVYQKQPNNVYFSHIAHEKFDCATCHPNVGYAPKLPLYFENKITGYSKNTMKMYKCERCHAQKDASNACFTCHK